MIPWGAGSEEGLHHLLHCLEDQCLQSRWGQRLEHLELQEPLWKQAHELSTDALDFSMQGEQKQWARQQGALWEQPDLSSWSSSSWGVGIISGVLGFSLSGFGFSCPGFLLF